MSKLKVWNGSSWVLIPDGQKVKIWNGTNWVIPEAVKFWNGTNWVAAWTKSQPITLSFYASLTTTLRYNGSSPVYDSAGTASNNRNADLFIGRYNGTYPYHYTSLMLFDGLDINNQMSITDALLIKPVVKSALIRLRRLPGGANNPSGYIRFGTWTQPNLTTLPATNLDGRWHDWDPATPNNVAGWTVNTTKTFSANPQNVLDLANGLALMCSEVMSGYATSGATSPAYSNIYGRNNGSPDPALTPMLTVTFDVV